MMKINFLLLSIFLFACSSLQTNREQNVSVMQQLESDYSNKKLTDNEFYTYLTYSVFAQENLPKRYNGTMGKHDATPIIRKVQKAFPTLSPQTQEHLKQWIKPLPPKPLKPGIKP
ncbi:MAG: hypothetical protein QF743_07340 [Candidatus Marinimicrobia bacterium]|nr:hypothetical protein [Candidatus Neomarinimicrobiota bacterium]